MWWQSSKQLENAVTWLPSHEHNDLYISLSFKCSMLSGFEEKIRFSQEICVQIHCKISQIANVLKLLLPFENVNSNTIPSDISQRHIQKSHVYLWIYHMSRCFSFTMTSLNSHGVSAGRIVILWESCSGITDNCLLGENLSHISAIAQWFPAFSIYVALCNPLFATSCNGFHSFRREVLRQPVIFNCLIIKSN